MPNKRPPCEGPPMFSTCVLSLVVFMHYTMITTMSVGISVSTGEQLFFALTNSTITDIQLTQDISLGSSKALWKATGGAVTRTANLTMRGSPQPNNPYYPQLDLQYLQDLIRMPPGLSFNMQNLTLKRHTLQSCGPDFVAASPGSYIYSNRVWRKNFTGRPYDVAVNLSSSRPTWAPGVNTFKNLTDGLCVASPSYKCWRAYVAVDYACEVWQPSNQAIHQYIVDGPFSMEAVVDDYCDMTQPMPPTACIANLTSSLESADQLANPQPVTVWVTTASQLVPAMVNSTVDLVLITQDITDWTDAQTMLRGMQLPVPRNRNITIRGAALPGVYPTLELKVTSLLLSMSTDSSVIMEHLLIKRLQLLPEPKTIKFTAMEWPNEGGGQLVLTDCLWHFYTCPSASLLQNQMETAAGTTGFMASGQQTWSMMNSVCIQQTTSPPPSTSHNGSLAAFPPSSYTSCFSPAVDMQTLSLPVWTPGTTGNSLQYHLMMFHDSWGACGEIMDPVCQQQWVAGNPTCVFNRVALLSGTAYNSSAPPPPTGNTDTSAPKKAPIIAIAGGVAGGAAIGLAIAGVIFCLRRRKRQQQLASQQSGAPTDIYSLHSSMTIGDKKVMSAGLSGPTSINRTGSPRTVSSGFANEQLVHAEVQDIFLKLAKQAMEQPTPLPWGQKVTKDAPLVEGLALNIDIKRDIVVQQVLGTGTHGVVRQGRYKGQPVALKMFPATAMAGQSFVQELHILGRLQDPHIVNLLAAGFDNSHTYLVLELCNTSLDKLIYKRSTSARKPDNPPGSPTAPAGRLLPLQLILRLGIQITEGLAYLHPTIIHRDLKPSNVLLKTRSKDKGLPRSGSSSGSPDTTTGDNTCESSASDRTAPEGMDKVGSVDIDGAAMTVKLADFGLSRMMASVVLMTGKLPAGTVPYMAPECFSKDCKELTCKCDIYSLGVVLWEMIHGQQPWAGQDAGMILALVVLQQQHLTFTAPPSRCPPKLRALIERCWDIDPNRRASATDVIAELALIASQLVDD